jgi:hypothetical protein
LEKHRSAAFYSTTAEKRQSATSSFPPQAATNVATRSREKYMTFVSEEGSEGWRLIQNEHREACSCRRQQASKPGKPDFVQAG